MNSRFLVGMQVLAIAVFATFASTATAAVTFSASLVDGLNTYQDQSAETIVDLDGNGVLSNGDILYGFARLDSQILPPTTLILDSTYLVFSQTITSVNTTTGIVTFAPTTNATYSLSALTGDAIHADAFFALYENPAGFGDLIVNDAGVIANATTIATGTFLLSAGLGSDPSESDDFFTAQALTAGAINLNVANPTSVTVANFGAGLSILQQDGLLQIIFHENVEAKELGTGVLDPNTLHQLVVNSGTVSGTSFSALEPYANDPQSVYSYKNQLEASVNVTVTPEPASMLVWSGLSIVGFGLAAARKRRLAAKTA